MIAKKFGEIPTPGELQDIDRALLDAIEAGFATVGNLIRHHRQKAALSEAMRLVGEANKYVTDTAPFKLKAPEERERLATVLWTPRPGRRGPQPHALPRSCPTPAQRH